MKFHVLLYALSAARLNVLRRLKAQVKPALPPQHLLASPGFASIARRCLSVVAYDTGSLHFEITAALQPCPNPISPPPRSLASVCSAPCTTLPVLGRRQRRRPWFWQLQLVNGSGLARLQGLARSRRQALCHIAYLLWKESRLGNSSRRLTWTVSQLAPRRARRL